MPLLAEKCQVAIKAEAVPGTAEALADANVIMCTEKPTWEPDLGMADRNILSASPSKRGMVVGTRMAKISFKMFQRGTTGAIADPGNLPDYTVAVRSCGMTATVSGGGGSEIMTVKPASLAAATQIQATVALYRDGKEYKIHGALGNVKKTYTVGSPVLLEFEFSGIYNTPTDVALKNPTYPTIVEPPFASAALTVLGFTTAKIKSLTFDLGNQIALRPYPNTATGLFTALITGRNPSLSIDVEEELAATKNWYNEWLTGTLGSIATGAFPSTGSQYNKINDTYPNVQYRKVGQADRDNYLTAPIDAQPRANSDAGNDECSWVQQ
jgi:hypothetical protein